MGVDIDADSSFRIAEEAQARGHSLFFYGPDQLAYEQGRVTNQYNGVRDLHLAHKLAEFLGVDSQRVTEFALGREAEVRALQEAVDEL